MHKTPRLSHPHPSIFTQQSTPTKTWQALILSTLRLDPIQIGIYPCNTTQVICISFPPFLHRASVCSQSLGNSLALEKSLSPTWRQQQRQRKGWSFLVLWQAEANTRRKAKSLDFKPFFFVSFFWPLFIVLHRFRFFLFSFCFYFYRKICLSFLFLLGMLYRPERCIGLLGCVAKWRDIKDFVCFSFLSRSILNSLS